MNACLSLSGSTEQQSGGFSPRLQRVLDDCSATATDPEQVEGVQFAILLTKESCPTSSQCANGWGDPQSFARDVSSPHGVISSKVAETLEGLWKAAGLFSKR